MKILNNIIDFNPFHMLRESDSNNSIRKLAARILIGVGKTQIAWFLKYIKDRSRENKIDFMTNIINSYHDENAKFPRDDIALSLGVFDYLTLGIPLLLKLLIEAVMLPLIVNIRNPQNSFIFKALNYSGFVLLQVLHSVNELLYSISKLAFALVAILPAMLCVYIAKKVSLNDLSDPHLKLDPHCCDKDLEELKKPDKRKFQSAFKNLQQDNFDAILPISDSKKQGTCDELPDCQQKIITQEEQKQRCQPRLSLDPTNSILNQEMTIQKIDLKPTVEPLISALPLESRL